MKIIKGLPPKILQEEAVGVLAGMDIEMGNLPDGKLHHPRYGDFACLTITLDGDTVYYIDNTDDINQALENVRFCEWSFHNGSFDITHLRRWAFIPVRIDPGEYWDTLIIERILWSGYFDNFSLDACVRRYFSEYVDKDTRTKFKKWDGVMTDELIHYACVDAVYQYRVAMKQKQIMAKNPTLLEEIYYKTDLPAMWCYLDIRPTRIDRQGWEAYAHENMKLKEEAYAEFPFNPGSSPQVLRYFNEEHGWELKSTGKKVITKYARDKKGKLAKLALKIPKARSIAKMSNTYGLSWLKDVYQDEDGNWYVYASWDVNKAITGRSACGSPNLMNIPVRDYPKFRKFFIARPGHKLIIADFSQQEPRISAFMSQDRNLLKVFDLGGDIYINIVFLKDGVKIEKHDPRRNSIKAIVLGISYGQTKYGLAEALDITVEEAEKFLGEFWELFPEWKVFLDTQQEKDNLVYTQVGRRSWINKYSSKSKRNAMNTPIQGTASDMKKRAIVEIWKGWKWACPFGFILDVHDELNFDVPEQYANEIAEFVVKTMQRVAQEMCPGVKFPVDATVCDTWYEGK